MIQGTKKETKGTREIYSLISLMIRWYIRGINSAGDFCYVEPGTVMFYLKFVKLKHDFQMKEDGTLTKRYFGVKSQLVFSLFAVMVLHNSGGVSYICVAANMRHYCLVYIQNITLYMYICTYTL